jgi:hypothetical protein
MDENESGFAGGVIGFYVGVMLGLALFRVPILHGTVTEAAADSNPYARLFGGIPGFEIMPTERRFEAQRAATHRVSAQRVWTQRASAQRVSAQRVSTQTQAGPGHGHAATAAARVAPQASHGD